jgi:hypothetical protein
MDNKIKYAIFASGGGTDFQSAVNAEMNGQIPKRKEDAKKMRKGLKVKCWSISPWNRLKCVFH